MKRNRTHPGAQNNLAEYKRYILFIARDRYNSKLTSRKKVGKDVSGHFHVRGPN